MYLKHFGLSRHPFHDAREEEPFFTGGRRGAILEGVLYALATGEGVIQVVGEPGAGKSCLARELGKRLPPETLSLAISHPAITSAALLERVARKLGLDAPTGDTPGETITALQRHLATATAALPLLILVEEAQGLSLDTLDTLRHLSDRDAQRQRLAQVLLLGTPQLDLLLAGDDARAIRERIAHRWPLPPLDPRETADYLAFRLRRAEGDPAAISTGAMRTIARHAQGLPRRIDILAHKAMLTAFARGRKRVLSGHVDLAFQTSGFLTGDRKSHPEENVAPAKAPPWWQRLALPWPARGWAMAGLSSLVVVAGTASGALLFQSQQDALLDGLMPAESMQETATPPQVIIQEIPPRPILTAAPAELPAEATPKPQTAAVESKESGKSAQAATKETKETVQTAKEKTSEVKSAQTGKGDPSPAGASFVEERLAAGKAWLEKARAKTYTIQLMVLEDDASLKKLRNLAREHPPAKGGLRLLPLEGGKHLVLLGEFANYGEAKASLARLDPGFRQAGPFVLKVQDVRRKISLKNDKTGGKQA